MSSKLRTAVITIACLTTAISLAILGLTASHVAFVQNLQRNGRNVVDVVYSDWNSSDEEWRYRTTSIWYLPANWTMQDTHALLVAGVISALFGGLSICATLRQKDVVVPMAVSGRSKRNIRIPSLPITLALNGIITIVLLAATGSAWYQDAQAGLLYLVSENLTQNGAHPRYETNEQWNFESWNHVLAPRLRPGQVSVSTSLLKGLARQAKAAKIMVLPALLLSVLALGLHLWAWRKHNVAVREHGEAAPPYDEVAWKKQADLEAQSQSSGESSAVFPVSPIAGPGLVAEMSGDDKRRAELMGAFGGHGELEGGAAAAENSSGEKM